MLSFQPSQFIMIFPSVQAQRSGPPGHVAHLTQLQSSPSSGSVSPLQGNVAAHWGTPPHRRAAHLHGTELSHLPEMSHPLLLPSPCFNFTELSHWNPPPAAATELPPQTTRLIALYHYKRDPNLGLFPLPLFLPSPFPSLPIWVPCWRAPKSSSPLFSDNQPNLPPHWFPTPLVSSCDITALNKDN
jgi:hypothetical protein